MSIEPPETINVDTPVVACDGGGGALGHPRVYLNVGRAGRVECGYCDRLYVMKDHAPASEEVPPGQHP
jgi:uncharacterized Zn-finger protein